jgi:sec-independent protein translocase protein TatB
MFPENRFMEILIIGALALIVVGPKDLPILMRKVGQFVGKMRGMAAEFRASFDELARQSELEELRKEVEAMRVNQQTVMTSLNPASEGKSVFDEINQHLTEPTPAVAQVADPSAVVEFETPAPVKPKTPRAARAKTATAKTVATVKSPAKPRKAAKAASKPS